MPRSQLFRVESRTYRVILSPRLPEPSRPTTTAAALTGGPSAGVHRPRLDRNPQIRHLLHNPRKYERVNAARSARTATRARTGSPGGACPPLQGWAPAPPHPVHQKCLERPLRDFGSPRGGTASASSRWTRRRDDSSRSRDIHTRSARPAPAFDGPSRASGRCGSARRLLMPPPRRKAAPGGLPPARSRRRDAQPDRASLGAKRELGPHVRPAGPGAEPVLGRVDDQVTRRRLRQLERVAGSGDLLRRVAAEREAGATAPRVRRAAKRSTRRRHWSSSAAAARSGARSPGAARSRRRGRRRRRRSGRCVPRGGCRGRTRAGRGRTTRRRRRERAPSGRSKRMPIRGHTVSQPSDGSISTRSSSSSPSQRPDGLHDHRQGGVRRGDPGDRSQGVRGASPRTPAAWSAGRGRRDATVRRWKPRRCSASLSSTSSGRALVVVGRGTEQFQPRARHGAAGEAHEGPVDELGDSQRQRSVALPPVGLGVRTAGTGRRVERSSWAVATTCPSGAQAVPAASTASTVSHVSASRDTGIRGSGTRADSPAATTGTSMSPESTSVPSCSTRQRKRRSDVSAECRRLAIATLVAVEGEADRLHDRLELVAGRESGRRR